MQLWTPLSNITKDIFSLYTFRSNYITVKCMYACIHVTLFGKVNGFQEKGQNRFWVWEIYIKKAENWIGISFNCTLCNWLIILPEFLIFWCCALLLLSMFSWVLSKSATLPHVYCGINNHNHRQWTYNEVHIKQLINSSEVLKLNIHQHLLYLYNSTINSSKVSPSSCLFYNCITYQPNRILKPLGLSPCVWTKYGEWVYQTHNL